MSTLIQCPACSQKFNLQGRLPALFTCTKCRQPMDLTGFPGYVPEPAAPAKPSAPERGGRRSAARRGGRDEDDDGDRRRYDPAKKNNTGAVVAVILGVFVVAVVVVVMVSGSKDEPERRPVETAREPAVPDKPVDPPRDVDFKKLGDTLGTPDAKKDAAGNPLPAGAKPDGGAKPVGGSGTIQTWSWPEDVTAEEKQKIEKALETAINDVGSSQREAEALLVSMGRKAIWRLVSEFKHIQDTHTFESKKGKIAAMIVDRTLRKIDGFANRKTSYKEPLNPESTLDYMTGVAKIWNRWLSEDRWKEELKPWDPRVDETDEIKEKPARSGG